MMNANTDADASAATENIKAQITPFMVSKKYHDLVCRLRLLRFILFSCVKMYKATILLTLLLMTVLQIHVS